MRACRLRLQGGSLYLFLQPIDLAGFFILAGLMRDRFQPVGVGMCTSFKGEKT
jgi:hypothetical protein